MKFILMLTIVLFLGNSHVANAFEQTYETCSAHAWDILKIAEYYQNNVPLEIALKGSATHAENARRLYAIAEKEGLAEAQLSALGSYMQCMRRAKNDTKKSAFSTEKPLHYKCGQSAAMNFMVLSGLKQGETVEYLKNKYPEPFYKKIDLFSKLSKELSIEYAINSASQSTSSCIENGRKLEGNDAYKTP